MYNFLAAPPHYLYCIRQVPLMADVTPYLNIIISRCCSKYAKRMAKHGCLYKPLHTNGPAALQSFAIAWSPMPIVWQPRPHPHNRQPAASTLAGPFKQHLYNVDPHTTWYCTRTSYVYKTSVPALNKQAAAGIVLIIRCITAGQKAMCTHRRIAPDRMHESLQKQPSSEIN